MSGWVQSRLSPLTVLLRFKYKTQERANAGFSLLAEASATEV